jgi:prepilin signal peptidase PulO-like enzyme (type II secretory pathway)
MNVIVSRTNISRIVGLSAGLSVPFILIAFNQDRFAGWIDRVKPRSKGAYVVLLVILLLAIVLIAIWTSTLADTVKVGVTVAIVVLGVFGLVAVGLYIFLAEPIRQALSIADTQRSKDSEVSIARK